MYSAKWSRRYDRAATALPGLVWAHKVVNTGDPIVRYWIV